MHWLNIYTPVLKSPEFIGCDPVARATWLYVVAYCCEQENGGKINGAKPWKDRQWQQTCGVTTAEIEASSPLLKWEGEDLLVMAYPKDKELEIRAKRTAGKKGGKQRAKAAKEADIESASSSPLGSASSSASNAPSTEGEVEGKRKGKKKENGLSAIFDRFWEAYPVKVKKEDARKSFTKVTATIEVIIAALESAKASSHWRKDNGKFIPHPTTWLNGKRWEDESQSFLPIPDERSSIIFTPDAFKTPQEILAETKAEEAAQEDAIRARMGAS